MLLVTTVSLSLYVGSYKGLSLYMLGVTKFSLYMLGVTKVSPFRYVGTSKGLALAITVGSLLL